MNPITNQPTGDSRVIVYFNPFAFTIEENNEFLRLGYEPIPFRVPDTRAAATDIPRL